MENLRAPFRGIGNDVRGRLQCYKQDWTYGLRSGIGYSIFFDNLLVTIGRWGEGGFKPGMSPLETLGSDT